MSGASADWYSSCEYELTPEELRSIMESQDRRAAIKSLKGWQPIETAPKPGWYVWLGKPGTMRVGFWVEGEQHESHGSKGGGWIDLWATESGGPRGLTFTPTHWQNLPEPPPEVQL